MRRVFGFSAALVTIALLGSSVSASAQGLPDEFGAAPEFWSTRYQRFYETLHDTIIVSNSLDRLAGDLLAPPDVIVDDPGGAVSPEKTIEAAKPGRSTTTGAAPHY